MRSSNPPPNDFFDRFIRYPLVKALLHRRSRRFGRGMKLEGGPLSYESRQPPHPLSIEEEAALAFGACGVTGYALSELPFQPGSAPETGGGNIMANFTGRTVASGDALHVVTVFVTNDEGTWMVKRPQDFPSAEISDLIQAAREHRFVDLYAKSRVRIANDRLQVPDEIPYTLGVNKWSLHHPGTTSFIPVSELTALYINILLTSFEKEHGFFIVDDRNNFQPAGIDKFGQSRGGHLYDDPSSGRVSSVSFAESWLHEFAALEQGAMLQNMGLVSQALGLGGFPYFAAHPFIWLKTLGFRIQELSLSTIYDLGTLSRMLLKVMNKDIDVPTAVGLEQEGEVLLKPFCPPYYDTMKEAVLAFIEHKYHDTTGTLRDGGDATAWNDGAAVQRRIPNYSDEAIAATIAYCEYIYDRYGRFPALNGPFRTVLAYQAHHLDEEFYRRFYTREALTKNHRDHFENYHSPAPTSSPGTVG